MADDDNTYSAFLELLDDVAYKSHQPPRFLVRFGSKIFGASRYFIILGIIVVPLGLFFESDFLSPTLILGGPVLACLGVLLYVGRFYYRHYRQGVVHYNKLHTLPEHAWDDYIEQNYSELRNWGGSYIRYGLIILGSIIGIVLLFWFFLHGLLFISYAAFLFLTLIAIFYFIRGNRILRAIPTLIPETSVSQQLVEHERLEPQEL